MRTKTIEKAASGIRHAVGDCDIREAIEMLGGKISYGKLTDWECFHIIKRGKSFEIVLDESLSRRFGYITFQLGQALGHLFINFGYMSDQWDIIPDGELYLHGNAEEVRRFAFAFLMPEEEVRKYAREHIHNGYINITEMDRFFGVEKMATARLRMLGYEVGLF